MDQENINGQMDGIKENLNKIKEMDKELYFSREKFMRASGLKENYKLLR